MSTITGKQAEQTAANYLTRQGYKIIGQNWRTRWCEIDIIGLKDRVIYFVEVKYRLRPNQGMGLDYITPRKLQQMHFAADFWLARHKQFDHDYRLAALEVSGDVFEVTTWIDDIS